MMYQDIKKIEDLDDQILKSEPNSYLLLCRDTVFAYKNKNAYISNSYRPLEKDNSVDRILKHFNINEKMTATEAIEYAKKNDIEWFDANITFSRLNNAINSYKTIEEKTNYASTLKLEYIITQIRNYIASNSNVKTKISELVNEFMLDSKIIYSNNQPSKFITKKHICNCEHPCKQCECMTK